MIDFASKNKYKMIKKKCKECSGSTVIALFKPKGVLRRTQVPGSLNHTSNSDRQYQYIFVRY